MHAQVDLRTDVQTIQQLALGRETPVLCESGQAMAERVGAQAYLECSALTGEGVRAVLESCARLALLGTSHYSCCDSSSFTVCTCCHHCSIS